ncbi:hypothetical protein [Nocardioides alcanivorans]|uniref:hypothetical protein n=1 Tax=Nocardioides alcanivorans TaxID=2897352 RepID=UPI001F2FACE7|nr:hypothetical protein [Nocardioides alcanivorans]
MSIACATEVMVVRGADVTLECGGHPMVAAGAAESSRSLVAGLDQGSLLGKRYVHVASGLQVLCVKPGDGTLSVAGEPLELVASKQLPSSD